MCTVKLQTHTRMLAHKSPLWHCALPFYSFGMIKVLAREWKSQSVAGEWINISQGLHPIRPHSTLTALGFQHRISEFTCCGKAQKHAIPLWVYLKKSAKSTFLPACSSFKPFSCKESVRMQWIQRWSGIQELWDQPSMVVHKTLSTRWFTTPGSASSCETAPCCQRRTVNWRAAWRQNTSWDATF